MIEQILYVLTALVLVFLNGFFVMAEFALVKVRTTRIHELARAGNRIAELTLRLIQRMDVYLAACQLGITIASLALGWIGERAFARLLEPLLPSVARHSIAVASAFVMVTFLHITLGEQVPKLLAVSRAERAVLFAARPLRWFYFVLFLPLWLLNTVSNGVLRLLRVPPVTETEIAHSEEELRMILGASHEQGQFTLSRLLMMENILDFGTLQVRDAMTPAAQATVLDVAQPWSENLERIRRSMRSRYPLVRPNRPRMESAVHIKDIAIALGTTLQPPDLAKLARPSFVVRGDLSLESLLTQFHQRGSHLAIVEDEKGAWKGLVTLEDVIEELIGTIRDEFAAVKEERLLDLVPEAAIELELEAATKEEAIRKLARVLARAVPALDVDGLALAVLKRENLASTGLGNGIAIPHARFAGLPRAAAAFARSPGLDFGCLDGKPAQILFLVATPPHDEGAHVRVLAKISRLLSSDYLRERLLRAKTVEEVREIFDVSDRSVPA